MQVPFVFFFIQILTLPTIDHIVQHKYEDRGEGLRELEHSWHVSTFV